MKFNLICDIKIILDNKWITSKLNFILVNFNLKKVLNTLLYIIFAKSLTTSKRCSQII